MNCSQFEEYASLYIDEMLTEEEMINFKKHLGSCESCSISLENLKTIVSTVNEMEEIDLPTDFTLSLRERLQEEKNKEKKSNLFNWKIITGIAAGLVIASLSLTAMEGLKPQGLMMEQIASDSVEDRVANNQFTSGYGGTPPADGNRGTVDIVRPSETVGRLNNDLSKSAAITTPESGREMSLEESVEAEEGVSTTAMVTATDNRKIINKGRLSLETKEFDEAYQEAYNIVEKQKGYFQTADTQYRLLNRENPDESLRIGYLHIRVPSENFNDTFRELKELGVVINENTNAQDITLTYRDVETEVLNLEIQEERLREILQKAEKIEDILSIENELTRVRLQINSMRGSLKNYDQLISLSTIEVEIVEVHELTEASIKLQTVDKGLWSSGKESFIKSVNQIIRFGERALINLYGLIPWALLLTAITLPAVSIGNRIIKKRRNNNEK